MIVHFADNGAKTLNCASEGWAESTDVPRGQPRADTAGRTLRLRSTVISTNSITKFFSVPDFEHDAILCFLYPG